MLRREAYLRPIRAFYDSDLVKIITGIRRCGKSVILDQVLEEIRTKSDNVIDLDFEDAAVLSAIPDCRALLSYCDAHKGKGKCYVFLDEVQRVKDWAAAVRTLRLRDCSVFISGSNSKLLSREFTKELSGRYVAFRVRPFVYKELAAYGRQLGKEISISDYLVWGGFPKRIEFDTPEAQRSYLNDLNETIIVGDIIGRYGIRKTDLFRRLTNFVMLSNARTFSARSVSDFLKGENETCSTTTVTKYIGYLEEAYAVEALRQFSPKAKKELSYSRKMYDADVAFNSIRHIDGRYDLTHNLENVVYNELLYMGYSLQVYSDGAHEIDFVADKDGKRYFVQVAYSVVEDKTYEREFSAFAKLDNSHQKILITNDEIDFSTSTVRHIPLGTFLQMEDLK